MRLKRQVQELQRELTRVRASRRVLLELVAFQEKQQRLRIGSLEKEMRRLRHRHHPTSMS